VSALHADGLAALRRWSAPTAAQEALQERFVRHLAVHPSGMRRDCFPDHITAGVLVLSADGDEVLLNLHRKARRWFHFGGHCEAQDASLRGAALREGVEESGLVDLVLSAEPLQLSEHTVPFCDPRGPVQHLDVRYAALAGPGAEHATSEESLDVRWWPVRALPDLEPEMHDLIALAQGHLLG
jgi:8-oxo-dGTP pyrophosphatase MutT (NUDIX family)